MQNKEWNYHLSKIVNAHTLRLRDFHEGFSEQLEKYGASLPRR